MTYYNVQFKSAIPELGTVGCLEQESFQGTLENRRGTHHSSSVAAGSMLVGRQQKTLSRRISDRSWKWSSCRL